MSSNIFNPYSFLKSSRNFPETAQPLAVEINKAYVDIAASVNSKEIAVYAPNKPSVTGQVFFIGNKKYYAFRQLYQISSFSSLNHGLTGTNFYLTTRVYGDFTDGTKFYPLPYVHPTAGNQVGIDISTTQIIFNAGGTAPSITNGIVILEWVNQV